VDENITYEGSTTKTLSDLGEGLSDAKQHDKDSVLGWHNGDKQQKQRSMILLPLLAARRDHSSIVTTREAQTVDGERTVHPPEHSIEM